MHYRYKYLSTALRSCFTRTPHSFYQNIQLHRFISAAVFTMSVEVITTISPTTNEPILTRNGASTTELQELPRVAAKAFTTWRETSLTDRQIIVKKFLKLLAEKKDELAEEITVQMGRPIAYTGVEGSYLSPLWVTHHILRSLESLMTYSHHGYQARGLSSQDQ